MRKWFKSDYAVMGLIALFNLVLHLIAIEGFGYFRDEFYYISCSEHLAFGYVDQPPLSILFLRVIRWVLGDSLIALRIFPALGGAFLVFFTGLLAKELGGRKFAVALASASAFGLLGNFYTFHIYSMNWLDVLFWQILIYIVIRIIKTGNPKLWIIFGLVAGLGLQNKISVLFLGFGIFAGLVLTGERKHFKSKYLWFGVIIAGLLFAPYVMWNAVNDWPSLEFMQNASTYKNVLVSPLEFFAGQVLHNNPMLLMIWLVGLWFFLFREEGKRFRILGWMYAAIYILMTVQQGKPYYMSAAYPILLAGGAVLWENWLKNIKWLQWVSVIYILVGSLILSPITLPVLPVDRTVEICQLTGVSSRSEERHELSSLPQHYADMFGWEEMVAKVAKVYESLTPEEQKQCLIYGGNYGVVGAINFLGKKYNLPLAISGHNNHYFWKPKGDRGNVLIAVGGRAEDYRNSYREVIPVDQTYHPLAMPYENNKTIYILRQPLKTIEQIWPAIKHFE